MKHENCTEDVTHLFCQVWCKENLDETGLQFILEKTNLILNCHLHNSNIPNIVLKLNTFFVIILLSFCDNKLNSV